MRTTGIWPVAPTIFDDTGAVDADGQKRALDCMLAQGVDGICILANFSEQFLITDEERVTLMQLCLEHIDGRVPVIVTISHYATQIAVDRAKAARAMGAAMVMMMPPYHGALMRGTPAQTRAQIQAVADVGLPIMFQDAPLSGVSVSASELATWASEIPLLNHFKIECAGTADKLRALIDLAGDAIVGPFDGEEGVTLLADLDAGATGSMTSALIPDLIRPAIQAHLDADRATAAKIYQRVLPIIQYENRQCGFRATKEAMVEGGVISSAFCRHPIEPLAPWTRAGLIDMLRPLDPVVLRFGK